MADNTPQTEQARALCSRLGPARWSRVVGEAAARAKVFDAVARHQRRHGGSWRGSLAAVAPDVPWPTFVHWMRRCKSRVGPTWERLLDERAPAPRPEIAAEIREAACDLRRSDRSMSGSATRGHLLARFGKAGEVSDSYLKRVWAAADVRYQPVTPEQFSSSSPSQACSAGTVQKDVEGEDDEDGSGAADEVVYSSGGTGLALIAAAEAELACMLDLAKCTLTLGRAHAAAQVVTDGFTGDAAERGEVSEVEIELHGKGAPPEGFRIRGVVMRRADSRHPHPTVFVTNLHEDDVAAGPVADHYLARWPRQEQLFRKARNGGGLNRSHGFGGGYILNVALVSKLEKVGRSVAYAQAKHDRAKATRGELATALASAPAAVREHGLALADKAVRETGQQLTKRQEQRAHVQTMPTQIYERDTGRDSLMTCLKLTVMALLEFALAEYFGGKSMEWRTFIEQFLTLPVTMRTTADRCLDQFHPNPRNPDQMAALALAATELNRRALHRGKRRLEFELLPAATRGP